MNVLELTETQRLLRANLRELRDERGWNQEALAEKAGFSEGYIKQLETGRVWVGVETITALATAFDVPEGRLFRSTSPEVPPDAEALLEKLGEQQRLIKAQRVQIDELIAANKTLAAQAGTPPNLGGLSPAVAALVPRLAVLRGNQLEVIANTLAGFERAKKVKDGEDTG